MRLIAFIALGGVLLADEPCPKVFPESLQMFLPASLPAGMRPFVMEERIAFVTCGPKGGARAGFEARPTGVTVSTSMLSMEAGSGADYQGPGFFLVRAVNAETRPPAFQQSGAIDVSARGQTASVPLTLIFTDEPIARSDNSTLEFQNMTQALSAGQEFGVWFDNAKSAVAFTASTDLPFLTVTPASGSGYARLWVQADFSKTTPGNYFGNVIVTAAGVANSPFKVAVRVFAADPEFWPIVGSYSLQTVEGGKNPDPIRATVQSVRAPVKTTITSDSKWLTVSPATGTTPFEIKITVDITALASGNYTGKLTFSAPGVPPMTSVVNVYLFPKS